MGEMSHANVAPTLRSDPRLFSDDIDIKFSRTLNSYKLPQIRHASIERLAERLIDLRFLSIDFLTTLLLTYRVFTTSQTIVDAVKQVYYHAYSECCCSCPVSSGGRVASQLPPPDREPSVGDEAEERGSSSSSPPRVLSRVEFSRVAPQDLAGVAKPQAERVVKPKVERVIPDEDAISRENSYCQSNAFSARLMDVAGSGSGFRKYEKPDPVDVLESDCSSAPSSLMPPKMKLAPIASCETLSESLDLIPGGSDESCGSSGANSPIVVGGDGTITSTRTLPTDSAFSSMSSVRTSAHLSPWVPVKSAVTTHIVRTPTPQRLQVPLCLLTDTSSLKLEPDTVLCSTRPTAPATPLLTSGITIPSSALRSIPTSPQSSPKKMTAFNTFRRSFMSRKTSAPSGILDNTQLDALALSPTTSPKVRRATSPNALSYCPLSSSSSICPSDGMMLSSPARSPVTSPKRSRARASTRSIHSPSSSSSSSSIVHMSPLTKPRSGKGGSPEQSVNTCSAVSANSGRHCIPQVQNISCSSSSTKACNIITSCRHRLVSAPDYACSATTTTGSFISKDGCKAASLHRRAGPCDDVSHITRSHAATVRVLTVLQHWIQRHLQDFVEDHLLRSEVKLILDDIVTNCNVTSTEHKTAVSLLKILAKNIDIFRPKVDLELLLAPSQVSPKQSFNTLSPMEIAEQMTYLDHQIFKAIRSEELLNQSWMKPDKAVKAPHVLLVSKRFNEASRLVVNEIVCRQTVQERAACIEKWTVVADICCCMHNYNGVLQISAAFVNSAVYRLKKTWEKISKQTRQTVDRLQTLVSSDGRFKNMRDALHRCDPPCIPYLGMYLTDLSFIEEGTSNITEDGLINFSKMRMITQVIGEIRHFQQVSYQIEHMAKVTCYLLDTSKLLEEEETYNFSLEMEPRAPRLSVPGQFSA